MPAKGDYADQTCPREMSTNHEQTTPPQNSVECLLVHACSQSHVCVVIAFLASCACVFTAVCMVLRVHPWWRTGTVV